VAVEPSAADGFRAALDRAGVPGIPIGTAAGETLDLRAAGAELSIGLDRLTEAWRTPF
jgi:hypothetical protein